MYSNQELNITSVRNYETIGSIYCGMQNASTPKLVDRDIKKECIDVYIFVQQRLLLCLVLCEWLLPYTGAVDKPRDHRSFLIVHCNPKSKTLYD